MKINMVLNNKGILIASLSGIFWSLNTLLFYLLINPGDNDLMLFSVVSALFNDFSSIIWLCIIFVVFYKKRLFYNVKLNKKDFIFVFSSIIGAPLGLFFYILSILVSSIEITTIITLSYPIFARIIDVFLSKKYSKIDIFPLLLLISVIFFIGKGLDYKCIPAILCALCWAIEGIICEYGLKTYRSPEQVLMIRQIISSVFLLFAFLLFSFFYKEKNITSVTGVSSIYPVIFISLIGLVSYLFYYIAIEEVGAVKAMSINISTAILFVNVFNVFFDNYNFENIFCAILILIGTILCIRKKQ